MKMETSSLAIVTALLLVVAQLPLGLTFSSMAPAFLWSSHLNGKKEMVDYRILAPRDLAKSTMTEGGWSKYLCSSEEVQGSNNFAFLFIGSELQSLEVSRPAKTDPALIDLLKDSISNSNSSVAFPYVVAGEEKVSIESSLLSEFAETCQHDFGVSRIALVGSCSVDGENFDKINDVSLVNDYLNSRIEKSSDGHTDLIVMCPGDSMLSQDNDQPHSESSILSQLLNAVNEMGAKYSFLYISDPFRSDEYVSHKGLERFLAEGTMGNASANSTGCDEVCQIKSSLLEGLLVGIVLLIILISGLCCMMGIDTPTRFETPEAS
ncbi:uncharacterized protein LOC125211179 [Salvia hispanica]|uniref:uncharacterized protein LOC125211179 n=1 Tax=Salvia hispanica TaxID=49212 RepID=UPI002009C184|nr:uncharacterized protein LOC125211179 [Salvia hispanica]XP_047966843.1 uncharacterized protein LOC125211179 [Salvia hispanica]